ncbi:hypothetical protein DFH11DRAFT_612661 [Phellopilus nigrolimitatus]|nr:hypothetical protein DFH11DRAFT_612661 [Phellopilus nigrolimitatus]
MASLAGRLRGRLRSHPRSSNAGSSPDEQSSVGRKKRKKVLNAIPIVLTESIKLLRESSDFCPPLKSAVGGVAHIISLVETMKGNKDDAVRLFKRADSLLDLLADLVTDSTSVPDPLFIAIVNLSRELQFSIVKADRVPKKHVVTRLFNTSKEKEQLRVLREQLDEAMERFKLATSVRTEVAVGEIKTTICNQTSTISHTVSQAIMDSQISVSHCNKAIHLTLHEAFAFPYLYRGTA